MPSAIQILGLFLSGFVASALASPTPDGGSLDLQKRVWHTGEATYYYPDDGDAGACGTYNTNSELVIAVSHLLYNDGEYCGRQIFIKNRDSGASATGTVVDECEACGRSSLDLSPGLFELLGELSEGELDISWHFT